MKDTMLNAAITTAHPREGTICIQRECVPVNPVPEGVLVENQVVNLYPGFTYQTILGFGGAMTESAAYALSLLPEEKRKEAIRAYFGENGSGYTLIRTHIDSCDFALGMYQAVPDSDPELASFSIERDRKYILPALQAAMEMADKPIPVLLSPWSPPASWKTPPSLLRNIHSQEDLKKFLPPEMSDAQLQNSHPVLHALYTSLCASLESGEGIRKCGGHLKPEYYGSWAKYLVKYVQAYLDEGIPVRWLSIQNEAQAATPWDSCQWTAQEEKTFLRDYLYPIMAEAGLTDRVGILFWDHNKENLLDRAMEMLDDQTRPMVAGAAFHWYSGDHFDAVRMVHERFPELHLLFTEGCCPMASTGSEEELQQGVRYAHDMIENLNSGMDAWFDWNLYLDEHGGPNHVDNFCSAPIMLDGKGGYEKRSSYQYIRQITQNIQPGAVRICCTKYTADLDVTAFQNPNQQIVGILLNRSQEEKTVNLRLEGKVCKVVIPAQGIASAIISENL